ncbi:MAG: shikimate kinase [Lachnospiraceae bacterium]|nr:shikimate kinase [Lachnospiraceae bacterium]
MEEKKKNVVLIGMPGAGKSTVGVVLAKRLGFQFLDADLLIQEQEGKLLHELISDHGQEGFLKIEERVNAGIHAENTVIATGGSAIYGRDAMVHYKAMGQIVYLQLTLPSIALRLGDLSKRGVAMKPGQDLEGLYRERIPLYESYADVTIDCEGKDIREITEEIAGLFRNRKAP